MDLFAKPSDELPHRKMIMFPKLKGVHWRAPTALCSALAAGIAFAYGHHRFYKSLDQTHVSDAVFDQQYNISIGTVFAFLVRACLRLAVGIAFWQVFWRTLRRNKIAIRNVDTIYRLLDNLLAFTRVDKLYRDPILTLLAIVAWALAFTAIVPPATLTIVNTAVLTNNTESVGVPLFSSDAMAQTFGAGPSPEARYSGDNTLYNRPSHLLSRLSMGTALQAAIPPIRGKYLNASYPATYYAPTLQCTSTTSAPILDFLAQMNGSRARQLARPDRPDHWYIYRYLSRTPKSTSLVPWNLADLNFEEPLPFNTSTGIESLSSYIGQLHDTPPAVFVATKQATSPSWDVQNCSFYNATYHIGLNFTNGVSNPSIASTEIHTEPLQTALHLNQTWYNTNLTIWYNETLSSQGVVYQAFIDSFCRVIVGAISILATPSNVGGIGTSSLTIDETSVMDTSLAYTKELGPLYAMRGATEAIYDTDEIGDSDLSSVPLTGKSLGAMLEDLLHNMTLALLSEPSFVSMEDSPGTRVNLMNMVTTYHYDSNRLWLAYGIAIFCTFAAVVTGCITIVRSGVSYSHEFSTILRATRGHEIDTVVGENSQRGCADPLPKEIAQARLQVAASSPARDAKHSAQDGPEEGVCSLESIAMLPRAK